MMKKSVVFPIDRARSTRPIPSTASDSETRRTGIDARRHGRATNIA
jgi:hypothetical protein